MKSLFVVLFAFSVVACGAAFADTPSRLQIACIGEDKLVKNADPAKVCTAILPKCKDLKTKLIDMARDSLEWKFYGYYFLKKDLKLDQGNPEAAGGPPIPYNICSVVGHRVQVPSRPEIEIEHQVVAGRSNCGQAPEFQNHRYGFKTDITYKEGKGDKWFSYVFGAYPWVIRANAYDVFHELKDDLSNLHDIVGPGAMSDDIKKLFAEQTEKLLKLDEQAKSKCTGSTSIIADCTAGAFSVTDPVQNVCTLAKVQLALNEAAMPNILVAEIMKRSKRMFDEHFSNIFDHMSNPNFNQLINHCSKKTARFTEESDGAVKIAKMILFPTKAIMSAQTRLASQLYLARNRYSCIASCLDGGARYYTGSKTEDDDGDKTWLSWINDGGNPLRKCEAKIGFKLGDQRSSINAEPFNQKLKFSVGARKFKMKVLKKRIVNAVEEWFEDEEDQELGAEDVFEEEDVLNSTYAHGFAGMIEKIIRLDICKQYSGKNWSNKCDEANIQIKPKAKR